MRATSIRSLSVAGGLLAALASSRAKCPFLHTQDLDLDVSARGSSFRSHPSSYWASVGRGDGTGESDGDGYPNGEHGPNTGYMNVADFSESTYNALKKDILAMFTDSQDFWPADFGNYAPFFIRLAWHCAGSYRSSDGRGGCDGGQIRFLPGRAWPDNANLDKALRLLEPIKVKYGDAVSWGDLITLTGNTAISSMGGPILGFCAGRKEAFNGFESLELGPTPEQEDVAPCEVDGDCQSPLGASTLGLIYVNPEGPMGVPDPEGSAGRIRDVFDRMGMSDSETVALIGGGHSFGKVHGACPTGPGPDPIESPMDPWPGTCGDSGDPLFGKGPNAYTSGFEGEWTEQPLVWDTEYFENLLEYDWESAVGPGGRFQWHPVLKPGSSETEVPNIIMLTTDVALLADPDYLELVKLYATDLGARDASFANAWYKLTTRDMGPVTRCAGTDVPPAQEFQLPLPEPTYPSVSPRVYRMAMSAIRSIIYTENDAIAPDMMSGEPTYAPLFVTLAFQCMDSYRSTDYFGGCNGARIRFSPQKDWAPNVDLDKVLEVLEPVKQDFPNITYADLIVLAGNTALGEKAGIELPFCGGRVDADEGNDLLSVLEPREYDDVIVGVRDRIKLSGLPLKHAMALVARPRSPSHMKAMGYSGSYTEKSDVLSNELFKVMLSETWEEVPGSNAAEYQAVGKDGVYVLATDLALVWEPEFKAVTQEFVGDNDLFLDTFAEAWTMYMNDDRFSGPDGNECFEHKDMPRAQHG